MGNGKKKKKVQQRCRLSSYLFIRVHLFSLQTGASWEHQMVGRICLLFSATAVSEPEVPRSDRLLQVRCEITLSLRPGKNILKDTGLEGFVEWARVDRTAWVYHILLPVSQSTVTVRPQRFGRIWMNQTLPMFKSYTIESHFNWKLKQTHA